MDELQASGINTSSTEHLSLVFTPPSRAKGSVSPAIIEIGVQHPSKNTAQRIAEVASQVYADYITDRQLVFLNQRRQEVETQVVQFEQKLRSVLEQKREVLRQESAIAQEASQTILAANERLLGQLPVILDDFRRQIGIANVGLAASTEAIDNTTGSLRAQIVALQTEWQSSLGPSLATLYALEAQPEFQIASIHEGPLRAKYEESLRVINTLSDNIDPEVVAVLEGGTSAGLVSVIGVRSRFLLVGGGVMGLVAGWILANLGEYLLTLRARRKATADQNQTDTSTDTSDEEEQPIEERQLTPV